MKKFFLFVLSLIVLLFLSFTSVNAIQTYVGVKILNLSDDPSASCAGQSGYGSNGRIRAISSMLPEYPIFFNLSYASNNTQIWVGNSTLDTDYTIGDTMYLPTTIDLQSGQNYTLFFDIDAIRIYLPLVSSNGFIETSDDNYWLVGLYKNVGSYTQYVAISGNSNCAYGSINTIGTTYNGVFVGPRNSSAFTNTCTGNGCEASVNKLMAVDSSYNSNTFSFLIYNKYLNLYNSTVGNFNIVFTFN